MQVRSRSLLPVCLEVSVSFRFLGSRLVQLFFLRSVSCLVLVGVLFSVSQFCQWTFRDLRTTTNCAISARVARTVDVRHDAPQLVHVPTHHSHCFSTYCLQSCVCARNHRCHVTNSCDHLMAQVTLKRVICRTRVRLTLLNVFHGSGAWSDHF